MRQSRTIKWGPLLALSLAQFGTRALAAAPPASPAVRQPTLASAENVRNPSSDSLLTQLIAQSLTARPEIASSRANVQVQKERISQAGALPDPMLQVGIQNDGFTSIEVGRMPTSYYSIMASQTVPWPGKLGLGQELADNNTKQAELTVQRAQLSTEAEVRRAYLALVLARDRLEILDRLQGVWERSLGIAKSRYEAGQGIMSDILRSQLELQRLKQGRLSLTVETRIRVQQLNRLRAHPLDEAIEPKVHVRDLPPITPDDPALGLQAARSRSPELALARLRVTQSEKSTALARKSYYPDLTFSAGLMYRGTTMPPMWLFTVGAPIPIFSGSKQSRAVAENEARRGASQLETQEIEQVLQLRVQERQSAIATLADTAQIYQSGGLLAQSSATVSNTLDQYVVGKVSLASVLEANAGYLNDEDSYLQLLANAELIRIAATEVSLEPTPISSAPGMNANGMSSSGAAAASGAAGAESSSSSSM